MRMTSLALIVSLLSMNAGALSAEAATAAKVEQEPAQWRKVAEAIPLGSKVKIQTLEGKRLSGTLVRVDDTAVTIKKNTRVPEAPVSITYDQIANLEREGGGGMGWGKAIGMGVAAGAGAILTIFVIALQLD